MPYERHRNELHRAGLAWENPFIESFNARIRDELLAITEFCTLAEAKVVIEDWRTQYNDERPHSSLGYLSPVEFHRAWTEQHQPEMALIAGWIRNRGPTRGPPPRAVRRRADAARKN